MRGLILRRRKQQYNCKIPSTIQFSEKKHSGTALSPSLWSQMKEKLWKEKKKKRLLLDSFSLLWLMRWESQHVRVKKIVKLHLKANSISLYFYLLEGCSHLSVCWSLFLHGQFTIICFFLFVGHRVSNAILLTFSLLKH